MNWTRLTKTTLALTIGATVLTGCSGGGGGTASDNVACPDGVLDFGVEPFEDPAKLEPAYQALGRALEEKTGCQVEVQVVEDYAAEVLAMQNGLLDLGQFGPLGFVFAYDRAGAQPLVSFATADGQLSTYTSQIWVPKDSDIQSIKDMPGHSLALGNVGSTSGDALPRYALKTNDIPESDVQIDYSGGHPEALLALVNHTVDAAQINSQTLATAVREGNFNPDDFRMIWKSDPIPNDPITITQEASDEQKEAVLNALLDLPPEAIEEVGSYLDVDPPGPLKEVTRETYQPLFDLAEAMNLSEEDA